MESILIKSSFTCYLIGDDHLLVQCAEILLSKKQTILGIISASSSTEDWALKNKIPYFDSLITADLALSTHSFDYLFSIINGSILPPNLLSLPQKMSINYHNSRLPSYAGAHAPAWAILNNESSHGVTWHVMTDVIDAGDILKQAVIEIDNRETGLSLSVKCYQQALISFHELVDELANQTVHAKPQNLTQRTHYDFNQKPVGNGWITWDNNADAIDRIFRALDLGHYHHNRLASTKFRLDERIYIISKLRLLNERSIEKPGTIIEALPNGLKITTQTNNLVIEQLHTLNGHVCILNDIIHTHGLHVGYSLPSPTDTQLSVYERISRDCSKSELFWVRQLEQFLPVTLPFQPLIQSHHNDRSFTCIATFKLEIPAVENIPDLFSPNIELSDVLLTIVLIYLYKLGNKESLGFIFNGSKTKKPHDFLPMFLSNTVPFSLKLNDELCFEQALTIVTNHRKLLESKQWYKQDIFYRYPELSHCLINQQSLTIIIETDEKLDNQLKHIATDIAIILSTKNKQISWYVNDSLAHDNDNLITIIKNIPNHMHVLVNAIAKTKKQPLSKLPLLSSEEQNKIIYEWNPTTTDQSNKKTITQLFEDQVKKTPHNVAVSYTKQSLTYNELNQKANQFSRYLQKKGVKSNSFCAISTDQELYLIISIIAILKAGAAYIPIDATYPEKHIQFILNDSNPSIVIASKKLKCKVQQYCDTKGLSIVYFESLFALIKHEEQTNLDSFTITPEHLAYLMYTSGTTGKPKGVMIQHQSITRLVKNSNYIQITEQDCIAQAASISFDAATFEIWGALLNGARLLSVPHSTLLNIVKFGELLQQEHVTILWMTSALFNQYAAKMPSIFKYLTYLLVGGDVLNSERIFNVMDCADGAPRHILNGYGPTENTTFTTTFSISKETRTSTIPIGKPITNTTVYILDADLNPVPIGVSGELYTGGDGVSKGYLNRKSLTETQFLPDPFSIAPGKKLYKTGDIVRWLPDGNIDYISRQDNQIKIRGFRVELEAIQNHLLYHPEINQCTIRAHEDKQHIKVLVAYIVAKTPLSIPDIHGFLAQQLPIYMIPSFFVFLNHMPLTLNGKINYEKLPAPNFTQQLIINNYTEPKTKTEKTLVKLWCALFSTNKIGIHNTFFDLGGHSLLITSLLVQLKESLGFDLILHEFLTSPTIEHLAKLIDDQKGRSSKNTFNNRLHRDRSLAKSTSIGELSTSYDAPKAILLTGATGFLGAHLLHDLYHLTDAIIYCLVRCKDSDNARARIDCSLNDYQLNLPNKNRIIPLVGDLSLPNLGLSHTLFLQLANEIDSIYHNGASVHHLYNYDLLRAPNVLSTYEIIKLATLSKLKNIHYISTLSAASNYLDATHSIIESSIPSSIKSLPPMDGYSQTKWVSEQLLSDAMRCGLPIKVYRPAWILGHSLTGAVSAEKNHLLLLIKGCIQMKFAPEWAMNLDILPVDIISKLIIKTSLNNQETMDAFNIVNPHVISWIDLINYLNQRGYPISLIPAKKWTNTYLKKINKDNTLYALYALYVNEIDSDWMKGLSNISSANNHNALKAFQDSKLCPPKISHQLLDIYFAYLEQRGFLTR